MTTSRPQPDPSKPEIIKLVIAKQRNAYAGGNLPLLFYKRWTRFEACAYCVNHADPDIPADDIRWHRADHLAMVNGEGETQ